MADGGSDIPTPDPTGASAPDPHLRIDDLIRWGLFQLGLAVVLVAVGLRLAAVGGIALLPGLLVALLGLAHGAPEATRTLLVRIGAWRLLPLHAHVDLTPTVRDRAGVGLLAVARCHLRRPDDPALAAGLDRMLGALAVVGPGAVVAAGIRSLVRGDRADARRLWRFAVEFDATVCPPAVARWAADLLAAEAASAGEHDRMLRELARPRMPATPFGTLLRLLRAKASGEPVDDRTLQWATLRAGPTRGTLALVARAAQGAPAPGPAEWEPAPGAHSILCAVEATVRLGAKASPSRDEVARVAAIWDRTLGSPEGQARIGALGAKDPDPVGIVRAKVVEQLAERLGAVRAPAITGEDEGRSPLFHEAVWRAADQRDAELGWLAEALDGRTHARRTLPLVEEVRAFCTLVEAYDRVVEVDPDRASASFPRLYYPVVRHTVWLHNHRNQPAAANAMYRVELRLAQRCAHDSGVALLRKNLACGPK